MKRLLLISCGVLSVGFGVLGIFLPLLPTTPFLLLAAILFAKSSPRLYGLLYRNRYLRSYIDNYRHGGGVPLSLKVKSIATLWLMLFLSSLLLHNPYYWLLLAAVGTGVTIHLCCLKTSRPPAPAPAPAPARGLVGGASPSHTLPTGNVPDRTPCGQSPQG